MISTFLFSCFSRQNTTITKPNQIYCYQHSTSALRVVVATDRLIDNRWLRNVMGDDDESRLY